MSSFYNAIGGNKSFVRIGKKNRKKQCVFFEAEKIKILRRYLKPKRKGSVESMPLEEIKMNKKKKFRAGLFASVVFTGVPEELVLINGSQYLKIRVVSEGGVIMYCYSEIVGGKCFCLELVA